MIIPDGITKPRGLIENIFSPYGVVGNVFFYICLRVHIFLLEISICYLKCRILILEWADLRRQRKDLASHCIPLCQRDRCYNCRKQSNWMSIFKEQTGKSAKDCSCSGDCRNFRSHLITAYVLGISFGMSLFPVLVGLFE